MTPALLAALWTLPGILILVWIVREDLRGRPMSGNAPHESLGQWFPWAVAVVWAWPLLIVMVAITVITGFRWSQLRRKP